MFEKMLRKLRERTGSNREYQGRVEQLIAQYVTEDIHERQAPIYDYWADTHIRPRLKAVMGSRASLIST